MGASTLKALTELVAGGHWALVGRKGERAAGNGAAMRIAPLAFFLDPQNPQDKQILRDVSRITHHHEEAYAGALAVIAAVRAAFDGTWKGEQNLLGLVIDALPDTSVRDRLIALAKLEMPITEIAARFGNSGYVVESVPLAIYGAQQIALPTRAVGFADAPQDTPGPPDIRHSSSQENPGMRAVRVFVSGIVLATASVALPPQAVGQQDTTTTDTVPPSLESRVSCRNRST